MRKSGKKSGDYIGTMSMCMRSNRKMSSKSATSANHLSPKYLSTTICAINATSNHRIQNQNTQCKSTHIYALKSIRSTSTHTSPTCDGVKALRMILTKQLRRRHFWNHVNALLLPNSVVISSFLYCNCSQTKDEKKTAQYTQALRRHLRGCASNRNSRSIIWFVAFVFGKWMQ